MRTASVIPHKTSVEISQIKTKNKTLRFVIKQRAKNYHKNINKKWIKLGTPAIETLLNTALLKIKGLLRFIFIKNARKLLVFVQLWRLLKMINKN